MAVNKIIANGETLIDLTGDSVTPAALLAGCTAHNAAGERITGSFSGAGSFTGRTDHSSCPVTNKIHISG